MVGMGNKFIYFKLTINLISIFGKEGKTLLILFKLKQQRKNTKKVKELMKIQN